MRKLKSFGPLFVIIAALLWSFDALLRRSLYVLPPTVIVFYEHLFGGLVLLLLMPRWIADVKKMKRGDWTAIAIVALFSGALGTILYTGALGKVNYIQYSVVVLLQQLQPVWAISASALLLKEKVTKRFVFWAILALISAYFISFKNLTVNLDTGNQTLIAAFMALMAGVMWGSSTAFSKQVLNRVSFLTTTALRFYITPLFALLFVIVGGNTHALFSLTVPQILTLVLITFSTGMVALIIYYYGLKLTPVRVTTICELVWPASSIFIGYFYYHESLSSTQFLGILALLFSIFQVTKQRK